ncbi:hypothetical protein Salat_2557100 [Sesamum alatum]|uniref:Uncharacterized protein n=1 Tax=Sesamum alatum TaxID=300844 RepID=A0AAE1XSK4_9LAMI|nr:hypothetical protein Salat_2557100 [Sesamum alatum]
MLHTARCVCFHTHRPSPSPVSRLAKLMPPSRCPLSGDPPPPDRIQAAPPTPPHAPPLSARRTTTLLARFDAGDRVFVQLHPLTAIPHRLATSPSPPDHHQPSSSDVLVMSTSSDSLPPAERPLPAENQSPPTGSMTAAPHPLPTPAVPPVKKTYSKFVQNNIIASLQFDPNKAAKKAFQE